ncbi:MAG: threonine synthase [Coriobacteriales bacterium]|nr:threonine synthase [Coriobacteriales bacterium]
MLYLDTRGRISEADDYSFTKAIVEGIAPGGGLFVPQEVPHLTIDEICDLAALPYAQRAALIYERFGVDLPKERIRELMEASYGDNFDDPAICPIANVGDGMHVLELWHGPTSAFKDMALQCLPQFFSAAIGELRKKGEAKEDILILVATSGDTGKAALEGFADREHISIIVFFPAGGVSDMQRLQMVTQRGDNVGVWGVHGNFDDCQTNVKFAFNDVAFNERLASEFNIKLSSANSINWGRLLPQVCYYVSAYACLVAQGSVAKGEPIDVCVPTGNFGNILAAYYAKCMGTPIARLVCASNENNVLTDFINSGIYDISKREFKLTPSPSMDILVSSNLERQLFELCGRDGERVKGWMDDLKRDKRFVVDDVTRERIQELYVGDWVTDDDCFASIREVWREHGYLMDPHTAVAWTVAQRCKGERPMLVASTAHWAKFGVNVFRALQEIPAGAPLPPEVAQMSGIRLNELISKMTCCQRIPAGLANLDKMEVRFTQETEGTPDGIEGSVLGFLE